MSGIKISQFVQIVDNEYTTIKITPSKNIKNGNSYKLLSLLDEIRKDFKDIVKFERKKFKKFPMLKKIIIEQQNDLTYILDIKKNDLGMYLIYPSQYNVMFLEKIRAVYSSIKVEEVEKIKPLQSPETYYLSYKNDDSLSLKVDKRENRPLNSILNVLEVLKEGDNIRVIYNFKALSNSEKTGFQFRHKDTMEKIKNDECILKNKNCSEYRRNQVMKFVLGFFKEITAVFNFLAGVKEDKKSQKDIANEILFTQFNNKFDLSDATKNKNSNNLINTNIILQSVSNDKRREQQNAISTLKSFNGLSENNELIPIKAKVNENKINPYNIKDSHSNVMSVEEGGQFIQIASQEMCRKYNLNHIATFETKVPDDLLKGKLCIGFANYREIRKRAYLSTHEDYQYLNLTIVGPSRAGKSNLIANLTKNAIDNDECVIIFDYIAQCGLSKQVEEHIEKNKVLNINCCDIDNVQSLDFNEMAPFDNSAKEIYQAATSKSRPILDLLNTVNSTNEDLRSQMERYLKSSLVLAYCLDRSICDAMKILQDVDFRKKCLNEIPKDLQKYLQLHVDNLKSLTKAEKGSKTNNNYLINGIINRLEKLKANIIMEQMLSVSSDNNINFIDEMQKNQLINLRIPEGRFFNTKDEKDVLCTFWLSKIWQSLLQRYSMFPKSEKRKKVNIVIDEIYNLPNCQIYLQGIISQMAKYNAKPIISAHYVDQLNMKKELKAANTSYMFLAGCDVDNFKEKKATFNQFGYTEEDLLNLKEYHSLNIIKCKNGFSAFITEMPKDIVLRRD